LEQIVDTHQFIAFACEIIQQFAKTGVKFVARPRIRADVEQQQVSVQSGTVFLVAATALGRNFLGLETAPYDEADGNVLVKRLTSLPL
jgi:hypothetical protein